MAYRAEGLDLPLMGDNPRDRPGMLGAKGRHPCVLSHDGGIIAITVLPLVPDLLQGPIHQVRVLGESRQVGWSWCHGLGC